jgi:hypothetical protein
MLFIVLRPYKHTWTTEFLHSVACFDVFIQFRAHSVDFITFAKNEMRSLEESMEAMSNSMTSYGLSLSRSSGEAAWPYVTIPNDEFQAHARHVVSYSKDHLVWITPVVDDIKTWSEYSAGVYEGQNGKKLVNDTGLFTPIHQVYPMLNASVVNYDTSSEPGLQSTILAVSNLRSSALSGLLTMNLIRESFSNSLDTTEPFSLIVEPVFSTFNETAHTVGYVQGLFTWKYYIASFNAVQDFVCVVKNSCGDQFSATVFSDSTIDIRLDKDTHDRKFDGTYETTYLGVEKYTDDEVEDAKAAGVCIYTLYVYPTIDFRQTFNTNAGLYTAMVGVTMLIMVSSFVAYDRYVEWCPSELVNCYLAISNTSLLLQFCNSS